MALTEPPHSPPRPPPPPPGPWHFLGPFGVGKTEIDSDPIAALGGVRNVSRARNSKKRMFASELAEGGLVGWTRLQVPANGAVTLHFPMGDKARVDFGRNVQALNKITALEMQGWLVADFEVAADGRYQLRCSPAHHVELDDDHRLLHGDVYSRGFAWSVVTLARGRHTLYIRVRCKGSAQLSCAARLASDADSIQLYPTNTPSPDVVASVLAGVPALLAMHVLNAGSSWRHLSLRVARSELPGGGKPPWARSFLSQGHAAPRVYSSANSSQWIAPGTHSQQYAVPCPCVENVLGL